MELDELIDQFWHNNENDDDRLTDDQKQQLFPLLYKREKLVREVKANRSARREDFIRRVAGAAADGIVTEHQLENETTRRLNEPYNRTDTQLVRLADQIEEAHDGPDPRPDLEA